MKILRNKKLLILSITAVALLTLTLGVSYAYFTATVTGNDSAIVTKIVAGILDVDFTITDRISNDNIILIKDERREEKAETLDFTVSNNGRGTLDAVYYVYLTDVNITNNLKSPDFKWELIKNNDTVFTGNFSSAETNTDFTITSETNNGIVIPVKQELSVGQVDRYKLRIWLSETEGDQNSLLNGSFSGKVRVTSTQLTGSEKYVVFKDQIGTQLGKKIISDGKTNYTMDISSVNLTGSTNIYCNNGGIPTISNNTLNIDGVTNNVECKISNDIKDTFTNQLTTSKTGIVMTNNQDDILLMTIPETKEVEIDLNGKELVSSMINDGSTDYNGDYGIFLNFGNFIVNDSIGTGKMLAPKSSPVIYGKADSETVINDGNFKGRYVLSSDHSVSFIINGGNFESDYYSTVNVGGSGSSNITINGGNFRNNTNNHEAIYIHNTNVNSVVNINGGSFSSDYSSLFTSNDNKATVNINNGTFVSVNSAIRNNSGIVNIAGGDFESTGNNTIFNTGTINVTGNQATFDSNDNYVSGVYVHNDNKDVIYNNGNITINNGTFVANKVSNQATVANNTLNNNTGTVVINNGLFDGGHGLRNNTGTLTINGGTFKTYGTNHNWHTTLCQEDFNGTTYVNGGTFEALSACGIRNQGKGTVYIRNATINSGYIAISNVNYQNNAGNIYVCSATLTNNENVRNFDRDVMGNIYYSPSGITHSTTTVNYVGSNLVSGSEACNW